MASLLLCWMGLLSGCASPEPAILIKTQIERLTPPAPLLTCQDSPDPPDSPDGAPLAQSAVAEFILRLWEAGEDCRGKLAAIRALVDSAPDPPAP